MVVLGTSPQGLFVRPRSCDCDLTYTPTNVIRGKFNTILIRPPSVPTCTITSYASLCSVSAIHPNPRERSSSGDSGELQDLCGRSTGQGTYIQLATQYYTAQEMNFIVQESSVEKTGRNHRQLYKRGIKDWVGGLGQVLSPSSLKIGGGQVMHVTQVLCMYWTRHRKKFL